MARFAARRNLFGDLFSRICTSSNLLRKYWTVGLQSNKRVLPNVLTKTNISWSKFLSLIKFSRNVWQILTLTNRLLLAFSFWEQFWVWKYGTLGWEYTLSVCSITVQYLSCLFASRWLVLDCLLDKWCRMSFALGRPLHAHNFAIFELLAAQLPVAVWF